MFINFFFLSRTHLSYYEIGLLNKNMLYMIQCTNETNPCQIPNEVEIIKKGLLMVFNNEQIPKHYIDIAENFSCFYFITLCMVRHLNIYWNYFPPYLQIRPFVHKDITKLGCLIIISFFRLTLINLV